jgi:hypothetical protein
MYGVSKASATEAGAEGEKVEQPKGGNISDEEEEDEFGVVADGDKDAEDTHDALKIVL